MPLTIDQVPAKIRRAIIAEHYREKMSELGSRRTRRKLASAKATLAALNASRGHDTRVRLRLVRADVRAGFALTQACKDHGVNYARAKKWLKTHPAT